MKTVLITGGTRRVGKVIADELRKGGWRVIVSSHRTDAGADIVADLSGPDGAVKLYSEVLRLLNSEPPDALVNNAALFLGDENQLRTLDFESPKKLTMLMAGRETGRGKVVNILDAAVTAETAESAYERAKADLADWTLKAAELFADTLTVNAVAPGPVLAPENIHLKAPPTSCGRPTPQDVAEATAFLLGSNRINGSILKVE